MHHIVSVCNRLARPQFRVGSISWTNRPRESNSYADESRVARLSFRRILRHIQSTNKLLEAWRNAVDIAVSWGIVLTIVIPQHNGTGSPTFERKADYIPTGSTCNRKQVSRH